MIRFQILLDVVDLDSVAEQVAPYGVEVAEMRSRTQPATGYPEVELDYPEVLLVADTREQLQAMLRSPFYTCDWLDEYIEEVAA